ncbi:serpin family protein [Virgibacillus oceani]
MKNLFVLLLKIAAILMLAGCGEVGENENPGSSINGDIHGDYEEIVSANNELGFQLISEVESDENGNTFISPTSLSMALSLIYNGAEGTTKEEISNVLQEDNLELEEWNEKNASLFSALQREEEQVQLHIANSIWLQDQYHFQQDFAQNTSDYYEAQQEEINFQSGDAAERINNWVESATNDKITDMVKAPMNPNLVTILINAIYFKGEWKYGFDESNTEDRPFYLSEGSTEEVSLMSLKEELPYFENADFQAVALPYGNEETMSMHVFLPKENTDLKGVRQWLTNESWSDITSQFQKSKGTVLLPKFELEYEINLNKTLQQLGLDSAFNPNKADFSTMIEEEDPIWIDQVKQKTFIEVNEEGTEAAAATSIEMETTSAPVDDPFYMEVNRPFFFTITDEETGTILFIGEISNP